MTSYLTNLLTTTTSKYDSLRHTLLPSHLDESDGDTDDDSHIARVLRAYYIEKGRPLPPWLPPDPKSPYSQAPPPSTYGNPSYGAPSPGYTPAAQGRPGGARRGGGLSDLWDSPGGRSASSSANSLRASRQQQQQQYPTSAPQPASQPIPPQQQSRTDRFASSGTATSRLAPAGSRPLPSQRENSYQRRGGSLRSSSGEDGGGGLGARPSLSGAGTGASTQDRLKARLWGGGGVGGGGSSAGNSRSSSPAFGGRAA